MRFPLATAQVLHLSRARHRRGEAPYGPPAAQPFAGLIWYKPPHEPRVSVAVRELRASGFARLSPAEASRRAGPRPGALAVCGRAGSACRAMRYLRDGGAYRARRHSCFVQAVGATPTRGAAPAALAAHYLQRAARGADALVRADHARGPRHPAWLRLLESLGEMFAAVHPVPRWFIEAHQFRIDTASGIGRPTPEGAHRDGVDFVAVILVGRRQVSGGETRVFEAAGATGVRFTLSEPWSMLLLDDARVIHETTPLQAHGAGRGARYPRADLPGGRIPGA